MIVHIIDTNFLCPRPGEDQVSVDLPRHWDLAPLRETHQIHDLT